ncbi:MAG: PIG-L family deacetylase [Candidatus Microthrix sp.]|nr:PIG-L family deacetylase [Candidatus Microthrix sp.]
MSPAPESQSHSDPQLVGIERVLVTCAHPDDVDFGAAGTVARWTAAGVEVTYCFVTDGEAGGLEDEPDRARVARMRRSEQTRAAGEVGVETLEFLAYRDGRVEPSLALRRDLTRVIRTYRPDRILTQSPERRWDRIDPGHPDHLATGEATVCAVFPDARNPLAHPELAERGLLPWVVPEVWLMAGRNPDTYVDITNTLDAKLAALSHHVSQHPDQGELHEMVRGFLTQNARDGGLETGRYAEAFQRVFTA